MLNYVGGRCVCAIETVHCTHICSFPAVVDADSLAGLRPANLFIHSQTD